MSRPVSGRLTPPSSSPFQRVGGGQSGGRATTPTMDGSPNKQKQQTVPEDVQVQLDPGLVPELAELRALLTDNPDSFNVSAFIDKLTKPLLEPDGAKPGKAIKTSDFGCDSAALHELFTVTLDRLAKLGKEADEKIASMEDENSRISANRKKEIDRHHRSLQGVQETIEDIETHFRKVGLTAVRIGQSLSQTEAQRQKAEHAQSLLEFFLAFNDLRYEVMLKDAESEKLEMLSHEVLNVLADERNYKFAANILSDLLVVCEDLNTMDNASKNIHVFADRLEKRLLDRFEAAAMAEGGAPDVATMRDCAESILQFGDAVKLYNTYIYTIVAKQIRNEKRNDGGVDADEMRDMLSEFFGTVSEQCQRAFAMIRQVFPPSAALKVTRMLIDRMVNDPAFGIHVKVGQVLNPSDKDTLSVPDSLDLLLMVHEKTNALATVLIDHCVEAEQRFLRDDSMLQGEEETPEEESTENNAANTSTNKNNASKAGKSRSQEALSSFVKAQFAELFIGQRQSYPDKELSLLRMRLTDALAHYAGDVGLNYPLEKKKKQRKTTGRKATKQLLQQGVAAAEQAETLPPLRIDRIDSYETITNNWLRKEVLNDFLNACREAISRNAAMFRGDEERADNVLEIQIVLHAFLASSVLLPTLSATSNIVQNPINGAPPLSFYKVLEGVHQWVGAYKDFFRVTALPEVMSVQDKTPQTVLLTSCKGFLERVERAGAKTLEKGLDGILRHLERVHREYITKTDYLPKDPIIELQPTRACLAMKDLLSQQLEHMDRCIPPADLKHVIISLGTRVQDLLCQRIKLLRINTSGALVLMQDVEIVYGVLNRPDMPEIKEAFDELKEIVGIFIVPPENIKGLIDHGHLANRDKREVYHYISLRADYRIHGMRSPWVRQLLEDAPDDFDDENPGASSPNRQGASGGSRAPPKSSGGR